MIPYVGLPITPDEVAVEAIDGGHAFVSHRHPAQLGLAQRLCQSYAIDNGAFSAWAAGAPVQDWRPFYEWAENCRMTPNCDFAVIPDVIDGDEATNDALVDEWPLPREFGAPVWHMHESLERLARLASKWPRVCIGSSGAFKTVGSMDWWVRIAAAMHFVCDDKGRPKVKLHGLRMLNPKVFSKLPFSSADSTNIARNVGIDSAWKTAYPVPTKKARARVMRLRLEATPGALGWGPSFKTEME